MKKIPTLFVRDFEGSGGRLVLDKPNAPAQWVLDGEGVATRKWDGTAVMVRNGRLYKRLELRRGRLAPDNFIEADDMDPETGKQPGWVPVTDDKADRWHREAWGAGGLDDGTYELVGPKIQEGERFDPEHGPPMRDHFLVRHGEATLPDAPRDFNGLREYLTHRNIEGIVWHHPDGRMAKIKAKDFGHKRPVNRWQEPHSA